MAEFTRAWAKKYFALYPEEKHASQTLTTITNTRSINVGDLNKELAKVGMQISNGYGDLKEKTFRIAHMGHVNAPMILGTLGVVEVALTALNIPHGKAGADATIQWLGENVKA